ncbi:hypothetical protein [Actinokineospora cianjurensis]|nr:hypothetical protein [Actinokineospora cianjurensis]
MPTRWAEKLPARRHRARLLCQRHADLMLGTRDPGQADEQHE